MSKYTTGEIAKLCGVSVRTVQYYDSRNILMPSELSEGGRRLYSEDDLKRMRIICFLRDAGLSINGIGELLSDEDPGSVISILLDQQERLLRDELKERQVKLGRLQLFNNWSPYMVKDPENTMWIGLEYFCNEGDDKWQMSDKDFIDFAVGELECIGVIDKEDVLDSVRIKVKKAYPAYFDTYTEFDTVKEYLSGIDNLWCIGRNGQHKYNNMDHSMLSAMEGFFSTFSLPRR